MKSMGFLAISTFLVLGTAPALAADAAEGEKVFRRFCTACQDRKSTRLNSSH